MSKWIKCDDYKKLPEGDWLIKNDDEQHPYHVANVTVRTGDGHKMVIVGQHFSFDMRGLIAYTTFEKYEDD